jgi:pSer/pThr/pTyr-binding forkhead associated (FHA) protein
MPRLIMRRGPTPGAIFDLSAETITVGRGSKNDIVIQDNEVSREHCRFLRKQDDYEVIDLGSSNGTFVNGQRIGGTHTLQHGSIIEIGDTITIEYERAVSGASRHTTGALPRLQELKKATGGLLGEPSYSYNLTVTMGPQMGNVYRLDSLVITVGRDLSNNVVIQDPEVSRFHARLRRAANGYLIEDMGSTNGTFVNGVNTNGAHELRTDDVIKLARQVRLQYTVRPIADAALGEDETIIIGGKHDIRMYADAKTRMMPTSMTQTAPLRQTAILRPPLNLPTEDYSEHVYVAYAKGDWDKIVSPTITSLQQAGLPAWVDQYLLQSGEDWRDALEKAMDECWAMVLIASPSALSSNIVQMGYRHFLKLGKPILVLATDPDSKLPEDLLRERIVAYDHDNPQRSIHKLILEVMHLRR